MKRIFIITGIAVIIAVILKSCFFKGEQRPIVPQLDLSKYPNNIIKKHKYDLCPPGGKAVTKPIFSAIKIDANKKQHSVIGNFSNKKGHIFSISVTGSSLQSVSKYIKEILVCGDVVPLFKSVSKNENTLTNHSMKLRKEVLSLNDKNLIIEIDFVAKVRMSGNISEEVINNHLKKYPIELPIKTMSFGRDGDPITAIIPPSSFPSGGEIQVQSYSFDFIIDPWIERGVIHDYFNRYATQASVTTSIHQDFGQGQVSSYLYVDGHSAGHRRVARGGNEYMGYSGNFTSDFDFDVYGEDWWGSEYQISGSLWRGVDYGPR